MSQTMSRPAPAQPMPAWLDHLVETLTAAMVDRFGAKLSALENAKAPVQKRSPYATVEEAAVFLRCKPQRVYDLVSSGAIERHKDGARLLIKWSDLELRVTATERLLAGARRANGFN